MRSKVFVFILLSVVFLLNILSIRHKSLTYDEPNNYRYGENILKLNSNRFEDSNMPFSCFNAIPRRVGELLKPFLKSEKLMNFLCDMKTGRFMTVLFSLLLAFYVFKWTKELYGNVSAFFSLTLYAFSPNIIAHSRIIHTDFYATCMITISTYYFWQFIKFGGWKRATMSACVLGLTQLAKYTCICLYPIFAFTLLVRYSSDLLRLIRTKNFRCLMKHARTFLKFALFFSLISIAIINIGFLFNKPFTQLGEYEFKSDLFRSIQSKLSVLNCLPIPLPYPYIEGLDWVKYLDITGEWHGNIYLFGEVREPSSCFKGYFLYAFLYKVPIPIQLFILFSTVAYVLNRKKYDFLKDEVFLLCPVLFFTIYYNFFFRTHIGIRFLVVVFPLLHIFCGSLLKEWKAFNLKVKSIVIFLVIYLEISVLSYFPHYLSYFNEIVWDRKQAYKILSDSNIDWGQNNWYLEKYKEKHPDIVINPKSPVAGRIVVEVNHLTGIWWDTERFRWLRENFEPIDHIAYSWLVYDIPPEKLEEM